MAHRHILLPGLDGTGRLWRWFRSVWDGMLAEVVYRSDPRADLDDHAAQVESVAGADSVDLIAESFSGPVALRVAQRHRIRLRRLVLIASFAGPPRPALLAMTRFLPLRGIAAVPPPRFGVASLMLNGVDDAALIDAVTTVVRAVPAAVVASRLRLLAGLRPVELQAEVPVLALQASRDRLVPASARAGLVRACADLVTVDIPGPHLLMQAEPVRCAGAIRPFLRANLPE